MEKISLKIYGNPVSAAGFSQLLEINNSNFVVADNDLGVNAQDFFSFRIEPTRVIYILHKTNVSSTGAIRSGSLKIAIAIPKGYKIGKGGPGSLLLSIRDCFLNNYMERTEDSGIVSYRYTTTNYDPTRFSEIISGYTLVPSSGAYRPMKVSGMTRQIVVPKDKMDSFLNDVHYKEFVENSEIIVLSEGTPSSIQIPRVPRYTIDGDVKAETDKVAASIQNRNGQKLCTIEDILKGKNIDGLEYRYDAENEHIQLKFIVSKPPQKVTTVSSVTPLTRTTPNMSNKEPIKNDIAFSVHLDSKEEEVKQFLDENRKIRIRIAKVTGEMILENVVEPKYEENNKVSINVLLASDWNKAQVKIELINSKDCQTRLIFNNNNILSLPPQEAVVAAKMEKIKTSEPTIKRVWVQLLIVLLLLLLSGIGGYYLGGGSFFKPQESETFKEVEDEASQSEGSETAVAQVLTQEGEARLAGGAQEEAIKLVDSNGNKNNKDEKYITYFQDLNKELNKVDITFKQVKKLYSDYQEMKKNVDFERFINNDTECIRIDGKMYKPHFFDKKIEKYNDVVGWFKNMTKEECYTTISTANNEPKDSGYPNMKMLHVEFLYRVSKGKNIDGQFKNYDKTAQTTNAKKQFYKLFDSITSFKDLEKIDGFDER